MRPLKSWHFGQKARALPVISDAEEYARGGAGRRREAELTARRHPSAAVPQTLETVLAAPSDHLVRSRFVRDVSKYARLYTGETYPILPCYEFTLNNVWLHVPSGFVLTADREILGFSSHALSTLYSGHSSLRFEDAPLIESPCFKLSTPWGKNYAHWLMDGLPKADAISAEEAPTIVLDIPSPRFQDEAVALLGLSSVLKPETEILKFRELRFLSYGKSGVPDPRPLMRVRDRLRSAAGKSDSPRRIYISRQRVRRKITNGEEVGKVLASFGFEEVFTEELSFAQQIRLFSGAEAVFGAHGAGTMNILFSPKEAVLIEAFNPQVWDHAAHRVASLVGIQHFHLFGRNASRDFDLQVDCRILEKTLALALDGSSHLSAALVEKDY